MMQSLGGESVYAGRLVDVRVERFRHSDGEVVTREVVRHRGAVGTVAHDDEVVWLVRQPREAVAAEGLLEIPAGRLDVDGESPEAAARRELAEEIGRGARSWQPILSYYSSPGFRMSACTCSVPRTCTRRAPEARRTSGSRSSPGRWRSLTARSRRAATPRP